MVSTHQNPCQARLSLINYESLFCLRIVLYATLYLTTLNKLLHAAGTCQATPSHVSTSEHTAANASAPAVPPFRVPLSPPPSAEHLSFLGRHLLVELYGCNANILNNTDLIENEMVEAAKRCGATVVQQNFHHFSPFGVSGVVVIAESHLTIHTWPEYGYAAIDLFTCGETCDPNIAFEYLKEKLTATSCHVSELRRGMFDAKNNRMVEAPFVEKTVEKAPETLAAAS